MPSPTRPRFGSMGVWPRKRAPRMYATIRNVPKVHEAKLLTFAGYKAGMTHVLATGTIKAKRNAGIDTFEPVTILECPPMKIASVRLYKAKGTGEVVAGQLNFKSEKELTRKTNVPKKFSSAEDIAKLNPADYSDITVQVYTMPKLTGLKKTPEFFEAQLGGSIHQKLEWVRNNVDKNIMVTDVFKEGDLFDAHAVTKGKGLQGPVKRFGVGKKPHKSEKGVRRVGSLGGWFSQAHTMYRVAHAGQMGFHQRVQYNNMIMKIGEKAEEINPSGGFLKYGNVKNTYVMIKGSMPGPKKRLVLMSSPVKNPPKQQWNADAIKFISTKANQGK